MNTQTKVQEGIVVDLPTNNLPTVNQDLARKAATAPVTANYPKAISKALIAIARNIGAIEKDGFHDYHKYHYQRWEDVLDRISPLLVENGIFIQQSQVASSLFENDALMAISYQFTIVHEGGEAWPDRPVWTAVARLKDNKGVYDDKCANKCHTQAHKYFLLHTFNIKTKEAVEDDSDSGDKKPLPNRPGAKGPRLIPTVKGDTAGSWAERYLAAVLLSASVAEVDQFTSLNEESLTKLATVAMAISEKTNAAIRAFRDSLMPKAETAKETKQEGKPLPPRPGVARVEVPDPDVARVEAGRDDGNTETWGEPDDEPPGGIPSFLDSTGKTDKAAALLSLIAKMETVADLTRLAGDQDYRDQRDSLDILDQGRVSTAFHARLAEIRPK